MQRIGSPPFFAHFGIGESSPRESRHGVDRSLVFVLQHKTYSSHTTTKPRMPYIWFPALRFRYRVRNRFRKTVSVLPFRKRRCRSRHIGEWPGRLSGLAGEFPAHPSGRSGAPGFVAMATEKQNSILYERINGNGKLTEMENVIFYVSYVILTYFCNGARRYGYGSMET